MSKLYDQLKNAAFARRSALERRSKSKSPASRSGEKAPRSLAEQKVLREGEWRAEIETKLQEADRELIPVHETPVPQEPLAHTYPTQPIPEGDILFPRKVVDPEHYQGVLAPDGKTLQVTNVQIAAADGGSSLLGSTLCIQAW